ncbi:MAG: S4 domain-containing protein, partial [Parvibaculum sp.]|nr:S4 domain-containing protein [Parvibaculum sp.]
AAEAARTAFEEGAISADLPTVEIDAGALDAGHGLLNALVEAGLCASTSDARRQIKGGAVRVNDVAVADERMVLHRQSLTGDGVVKLSLGKKKHVLLKPKA